MINVFIWKQYLNWCNVICSKHFSGIVILIFAGLKKYLGTNKDFFDLCQVSTFSQASRWTAGRLWTLCLQGTVILEGRSLREDQEDWRPNLDWASSLGIQGCLLLRQKLCSCVLVPTTNLPNSYPSFNTHPSSTTLTSHQHPRRKRRSGCCVVI